MCVSIYAHKATETTEYYVKHLTPIQRMQFTAEMIAGLLGGTIVGDKSAAVSTVSSIDGGKPGSLAYLTNPKYEQYIYTTEASIVLVDNTFEPKSEIKATHPSVCPCKLCTQLQIYFDDLYINFFGT